MHVHRRLLTVTHQAIPLLSCAIRLLALCMLFACAAPLSAAELKVAVDWPAFMSRHDLVWEKLPDAWHEGAFVGNGLLGAVTYLSEDGRYLRWDVGRSDVTDRGGRIPIGTLTLKTVGALKGGTMRLGLWDAELTGELQTDKGVVRFRCFTHASDLVTLIDIQTTEGERGARFEFAPGLAADAGKVYSKKPLEESDRNPEPQRGVSDGTYWVRQPLKQGEHSTALRESVNGDHRVMALSTGFSSDAASTPGSARAEAIKNVEAAAKVPLAELERTHRQWWQSYWQKSFLSIPDTRMESFYTIQLYKLASATRADRPALDLMGPWFRTTPWPAIWWNLNIQLTYWPVYTANRLELGESFTRMIDAQQQNLIKNAPEKWRDDSAFITRATSYDLKGSWMIEYGNLTWALHDYWLQYRYSMEERHLRGLYPILRRSVNFLIHQLSPGDDGYLHFPVDISPEYPDKAADTNYNIAMLRWGLQILIAADAKLNINDPLLPKWKEVQAKLVPYQVDPATGLMIGKGVPLMQSHRHFSHLLMIYPLCLMNWDQPENRPLIEKSVDHWLDLKGGHQGYTYTGAAAMKAQMGRGNDATRLLNEFLDTFVKPNSMYVESGPVIETPLAGAAAVQDMLLQSWGGKIRIFPAVPDAWKDVTFHNLRAEGAFLVSASRRNGKTRWVRIESLAGEPVTLLADFLPAGRELALKKGTNILLLAPDATTAVVEPVAAQEWRMNYYGSIKATANPPVEAAASGIIRLTAERGTIVGESLFLKKENKDPSLVYWVKPRDKAVWSLRINQPGRYRVSAVYGSPGGGNRFYVKVAGTRLAADVRGTGGYDTPKEFTAAEVELRKAGILPVEVGVDGELQGGLFNLNAIVFTPVQTPATRR